MKREVWLLSICVLSLTLLITQGCGFNSSQTPKVAATPASDAPRPVTDLSQVAPGNALNPFGKKDEQAIARRVAADDDSEGRRVENLGAYGAVQHVGDDKHPGELRLLNKKAAEFETLSMRLMDQVFNQVEHLQEQDEISHLKLPTDLRWVIITGTLNRQGVLKELVIEQHSGTAAIDKMAIAACKKGLYIHNPPPDAADESGNYRVRIQTRLETFASLDGEHWEFRTYMGLAFL